MKAAPARAGALWAFATLVVTSPCGAQQQVPVTTPTPGERVRVQLDAPAPDWIEGRIRMLDAASVHLSGPGGRGQSFPWARIRRFEAWQPAESNPRIMAAAIGTGALVGGVSFGALSTWDRESPHPGVAAIGALLFGGVGWVVGHAVTHDRGSWLAIPAGVVRPSG